jgi:hypothetical protein
MKGVEGTGFRLVPKSIDQSLAEFRDRFPLQGIPPPCAIVDERHQTFPVFGIGRAGSQNECSPALQFRQLAEQERCGIFPDEFLRQFGLPRNTEVQGRGKIRVQIVHRLSAFRSSSTGLLSQTGCFFSQSKWRFQSGLLSRLGRPAVNVSGGPSELTMTTVSPCLALRSQLPADR